MMTLLSFAGCVALLAAAGLVLMTFVHGSRSQPGPVLSPAIMRQHLFWRCFYVNKDDPRGWVAKTSGIGQTVNFRTRRNALIFIGMIIAALSALVVCLIAWLTL
ncbi:MAG TPA: hypothetical protein PKA37_16625 [Planctomycetota bacterium]|nr:hypothetical protein [Planctomycetota bacterium]